MFSVFPFKGKTPGEILDQVPGLVGGVPPRQDREYSPGQATTRAVQL